MATYKEIKGTQIEAVATDPSNPVEGQVWYNTTSNVLKGQSVTASGAWSSVNNLNTARYAGGGAGTTSAGLYSSGVTTGGNDSPQVESWNGTNWTEVNDVNNDRNGLENQGVGTQSAAMIFGGYDDAGNAVADTEQWNGTNWTEVNNVNQGSGYGGGAGTQTAAVYAGGYGAPPPGDTRNALTETWNGTNWTEVNDLNTGRYNCGSSNSAPSTSMILFGGGPPNTGKTEQWNGTNWTETNDMNNARNALSGAGVYASAIGFGGNPGTPPVVGLTEEWNGTNWTEVADMSVGSVYRGAIGLASSALAIGQGASPHNGVELWTGAGVTQTRTFTDS